MSDSQRQPSFVPHSAVVDATAQPLKGVVDSEPQFEPPDWGQEEEWRHRLHCLQEFICELLIKNQQLRMTSLDSPTDGQFKESIPLLEGRETYLTHINHAESRARLKKEQSYECIKYL